MMSLLSAGLVPECPCKIQEKLSISGERGSGQCFGQFHHHVPISAFTPTVPQIHEPFQPHRHLSVTAQSQHKPPAAFWVPLPLLNIASIVILPEGKRITQSKKGLIQHWLLSCHFNLVRNGIQNICIIFTAYCILWCLLHFKSSVAICNYKCLMWLVKLSLEIIVLCICELHPDVIQCVTNIKSLRV